MLIVFTGVSCVGKTLIMNYLHKEKGWQYVRNITTRLARLGEYHKISVNQSIFNQEKENGNLQLVNDFFGDSYGYLSLDLKRAISTTNEFWMIDFGIENLNQLSDFSNTYRIIVLPESIEFLRSNILNSDRPQRLNDILKTYQEKYAFLSEGYNHTLNSQCIINYKNDIASIIYKSINFIIKEINHSLTSSFLLKAERLKLILENLKFERPASSGLEAYKILTDCINKFEDMVWGYESYTIPRTFLNGQRTDRLYTILTESFHSIPYYTGVTLLLSKVELVFISRFGAIEFQYKDMNDPFGEKIGFDKREDKVFFRKNDSKNEGVWHNKNK